MPQKGTTKRTERDCLVCGGVTRVAHLGIDLCRACAIFYRRSAKRRQTSCRARTNQCEPGKGLNCKKCRYELIERMTKNIPRDESTSSPIEAISAASECSLNGSDKETLNPLLQAPSPCTESLLERLRVHYRSMCNTRMVAELYARGEAPHPLRINVDSPPTFPAHCKTMQIGNKILLTSLLEFGSAVFPEYQELEEQEKWGFVTDFFYRFRTFEGCVRANALFPEHRYRFLPNFTSYLAPEVYATFYDGFPANADLEGAMRYLQNSNFSIKEVAGARDRITRLNPHHEEFLAVLGLMFWNIDGHSVSQDISDLSEKYTKQIMRELHAFYRDKLKLDDYATRLGELHMFIQLFDVKERYREHFEMMRLLNIFDDDNFIYRLQKE